MIEQEYNLNLIPYAHEIVRGARFPTVTLSQFDAESRKVIFHLFVLGNTYPIPSGATGMLTGTKPDGTSIAYALQMEEDGHSVSLMLPQQVSTVAGKYPAEVVLYDSEENRLGSANFFFLVEPTAADEEGIASETDIPVFTEYVSQAAAQASAAAESAQSASESANTATQAAASASESAQTAVAAEQSASASASSAVTAAESAEANATLSESWAVGGTGTRTLEDYDNSKYYSELSKQVAGKAGWVDFYIDSEGYLHYRKTPNTELEFYIENGYLHVRMGI